MHKIPAITFSFWVMKICATTLGETAGDLLSMTLNIGYALSSLLLISIFFLTLFLQLRASHFHAFLFWSVILSTSTAGTTLSDYMDRTLALGYPMGASILVILLLGVFALWKKFEGSIDIASIKTTRAEIFYWSAILVSNTLGTALGDFLADSSGLGFSGGAALIGGLILLTVFCYYYTSVSRPVLFWSAFVLTRPFGATIGDLLTKPFDKGGLNFGTTWSSATLVFILIFFILLSGNKKPSGQVS